MSETPEAHATCKNCENRIDKKPPFCIWLKAEIPVGLPDDPTCEGFFPKVLRTSVGKRSRVKATSVKGDDESVDGAETSVDKPQETTCHKTEHSTLEHERQRILQALQIKSKGSVVLEKVRCGKVNCWCNQGHPHGPYRYWHFFEAGRVKRKYLGRELGDLVSKSVRELESRLCQIDGILARAPQGMAEFAERNGEFLTKRSSDSERRNILEAPRVVCNGRAKED